MTIEPLLISNNAADIPISGSMRPRWFSLEKVGK
jgi:hypothetical protein